MSPSFQFLGIPPKGERSVWPGHAHDDVEFPISRDPPEGGTLTYTPSPLNAVLARFPISRDPPEGGTEVPVVLASADLADVSNF